MLKLHLSTFLPNNIKLASRIFGIPNHHVHNIKCFSTSLLRYSSEEQTETENLDNNEKTNENNVNNEKQERNINKLFKKRDHVLETARKFKDLNKKYYQPVEEPKKKKPSPELKKAVKLLRYMDDLERYTQGKEFKEHSDFSKYDNDDESRMPEKKSKLTKNRRTLDMHLEERNFNLQKPVPRKLFKGDQKEIRRARKIIDDDEKHLKNKKPHF